MIENLVRIVTTSVIIFVLTEIAKRSSFVAAIVASSPIATVATCFWLYGDNQPLEKISAFAGQTALLLPPSLIFFIGFPIALRCGIRFWLAMLLLGGGMILGYGVYIFMLKKCGIKLV